MSDINKDVVPIPGGEKLLQNVESTGQTLIGSGETVQDFKDKISKEQLIQMVEGHARIGKVMVEAIERVRRKMELRT